MILSFRHRFILVRARKVAGTSVEMALSTLCGDTDIANPMIPPDELLRQRMNGFCRNYSDNPAFEKAYVKAVLAAGPEMLARLPLPPATYHAHMSVREIAQRHPGAAAGFRVICVERDPYAKVISALTMEQGFSDYARLGEMRGKIGEIADAFDRMAGRGFDYLRSLDLYRDAAGAIIAEPLRYERLQDDLDAFVRSIGITRRVTLPHAKKGLMANSIDPASVFRRDQIDTINRIFAEEFEHFGYPRL